MKTVGEMVNGLLAGKVGAPASHPQAIPTTFVPTHPSQFGNHQSTAKLNDTTGQDDPTAPLGPRGDAPAADDPNRNPLFPLASPSK